MAQVNFPRISVGKITTSVGVVNGDPETYTHNVEADCNFLAVVVPFDGELGSVTTIRIDQIAGPYIFTRGVVSSNTANRGVEIWYLKNPPIGPQKVIIDFSASFDHIVSIISVKNADLRIPIQSNTQAFLGVTQAILVNILKGPENLIIDGVTSANPLFPGPGQIQRQQAAAAFSDYAISTKDPQADPARPNITTWNTASSDVEYAAISVVGVNSIFERIRKRFFWFAATSVSAIISGTITPSSTEAEIVTGGKTIIITLTGDTWIAAGAASFDLQRANILQGLDSAQSEATGWNLQVRDTEVVTAVVRTSDTVVTITLSASPLYNITANETITVTVPGTAVTGGNAIVATPTFDVTFGIVGAVLSAFRNLLGVGI